MFPPGTAGWEQGAVAWLLDQCPADYRRYAAWRRHPLALAWLALRHVDAQLGAMREAYRGIRVDIGDELGPEGVQDVLAALEVEGARLVAARRAVGLVLDALDGRVFIPRL